MDNTCYVCHVCGFESAFSSKESAVVEFKNIYINMIQKYNPITGTNKTK